MKRIAAFCVLAALVVLPIGKDIALLLAMIVLVAVKYLVEEEAGVLERGETE